MTSIGTPNSTSSTKVMLCGAGELGKEVVIELQRLGVEVVAVDRYPGAPAMQVAHRHHVVNMLDEAALSAVIEQEKPDIIVPEVEALATQVLLRVEGDGTRVVPTARAAHLTMNRKGIRSLAAEELGLPTSAYRFADSLASLQKAADELGFPCFVKPIMSSSGKGQSYVRSADQVEAAWLESQKAGRAGAGEVIVEAKIDFDYEITLLTVRASDGTHFCEPIGHVQKDGDYQQSWQPQVMTDAALQNAQSIAKKVTDNLGGWGVFGVELFVKGDEVYFSEVSPRPHDTGLVTLVSQTHSEFKLHARAILGLPILGIECLGASASSAILVEGSSTSVSFGEIDQALNKPGLDLRLFGKPEVDGKRRMGVALARGDTVEEATTAAMKLGEAISISL